MNDQPPSDADSPDPSQPPRRLIGQVWHVLFLSAPRFVAEGIKARLVQSGIPVHLETPFTSVSLPEAYMGTYTGHVSLWVPEILHDEAVLVVERDHQGEPP
jgi:hypothetical protein